MKEKLKKIGSRNLAIGGICFAIIFGIVGILLNSYSVMEPIPSISFSSKEMDIMYPVSVVRMDIQRMRRLEQIKQELKQV